jgi:hypothetical protein
MRVREAELLSALVVLLCAMDCVGGISAQPGKESRVPFNQQLKSAIPIALHDLARFFQLLI